MIYELLNHELTKMYVLLMFGAGFQLCACFLLVAARSERLVWTDGELWYPKLDGPLIRAMYLMQALAVGASLGVLWEEPSLLFTGVFQTELYVAVAAAIFWGFFGVSPEVDDDQRHPTRWWLNPYAHARILNSVSLLHILGLIALITYFS